MPRENSGNIPNRSIETNVRNCSSHSERQDPDKYTIGTHIHRAASLNSLSTLHVLLCVAQNCAEAVATEYYWVILQLCQMVEGAGAGGRGGDG